MTEPARDGHFSKNGLKSCTNLERISLSDVLESLILLRCYPTIDTIWYYNWLKICGEES